MINHYRTLGVDPHAKAVVIRSAYLALIRRYHPDKGGDEADPVRATAVTAAWEVLGDPNRRAAYDQGRFARFQPEGDRLLPAALRKPRVRGGTAGRNLFLALTAGTLALGWWAFGQPIATAPTGINASPTMPADAPRTATASRAAETERRLARKAEVAEMPRLPVTRVAPDVEPDVELPPLPRAGQVPRRVRMAEAQTLARREGPTGKGSLPALPSQRPANRSEVAATAADSAPSAQIDLAPLERHLQLLTDQSLRYGTEAKRSRLFATRETFLKRLRDCTSDTCKRDAYLRRNAEVGEIMRN